VTPEEYLGDVMGDLNSRRGKIDGIVSAQRCARGESPCAVVGDVWLRNTHALHDAGTRTVYDAVFALR